MVKLFNETLRCPESLAFRWSKLPTRIGYSVVPMSAEHRQKLWEEKAAGELKRVAMGFTTKEKQIDAALIEKVISLDQSAFVITGATAILVEVNQDYFEIYDSTCSWWIEMWVRSVKDPQLHGYESGVKFCLELSNLTMNTLGSCFMASGAKWPSGGIRERLFLCPVELATQWPAKLLAPEMSCDLFPLYEKPASPAPERFLCGRIRKLLGGVTIRSGPAFDPSTWNEAAFLAIEEEGWFRKKTILDYLTKKAIENGAILLKTPDMHHSSSFQFPASD